MRRFLSQWVIHLRCVLYKCTRMNVKEQTQRNVYIKYSARTGGALPMFFRHETHIHTLQFPQFIILKTKQNTIN